MTFIHLRVHSAYSLLEGALKLEQIIDLCQRDSMPAVALTDKGNLFGALEFSLTAQKSGIQPIIGCQIKVAVAKDQVHSHFQAHQLKNFHHLVLFAQNDIGYRNLIQLVSDSFTENDGFNPPHTTYDQLQHYHDGLLALTGGVDGPLTSLLQQQQGQKAEDLLLYLADLFKDRLYVELNRLNIPNEAAIEESLIDLAYKHNLPLVATNPAYFEDEDTFEAHDALLCIADGTYVNQAEERRRLNPNYRFKSAAEMAELFSDLPEALANTALIAKRCHMMPMERDPILPLCPLTEGKSEEDYLREITQRGLQERLDHGPLAAAPEIYQQRLDQELTIIIQMGFQGYFLIVADFIQWAKKQDIPVGPGRGSGAGSVVAWALKITDLDPLRWGLLFERFLNPERVSMPDFDIDFCQDRRDEVITYVQQRYGEDRVAQIITFGKLQARAVLRDVGRVLQIPYGQVDRICKMIPNNPAAPLTLEEALAADPMLQEMRKDDPTVAKLMAIGLKLEGLYRHASTHAAGVVIGDRPLTELIPLYRDPRSTMRVTQFSMKYVEKAGLVKFDFLGLKTLTIIKDTVDLLRQQGIDLTIDAIPFDHQPTFDLLGRAEAAAVFQLESAGMRDVLRKMKPDCFEDIIAVVALFRPGPMDNIPRYIACKHGTEQPDYLHPSLEGILKETHGIMIYQEQVMQIAQVLAGYTLGGADLLRRAMGKKIKSEMDDQRQSFIEGAVKNGVDAKQAEHIFEQVEKFAGYGFNKSHAAAYALIAYQTAYLKANYPVEFMAACLSHELSNTDKIAFFYQELQRLKIKLLPPDVNYSQIKFTTEIYEDQKCIRYALAAIKGVGAQAMASLVQERETHGRFKDLVDCFTRLDANHITKKQLESLAASGAFDSLYPNRRDLFESSEDLSRYITLLHEERQSQQASLFGGPDSKIATPPPPLKNLTDWSSAEKLQMEFEAIGFYLSTHPLTFYQADLDHLGVRLSLENLSGVVKLPGCLIKLRKRISPKGQPYAFLTFSHPAGSFEVTVFSDLFVRIQNRLEEGQLFILTADVQIDDEQRLLALDIQALEDFIPTAYRQLTLYISETKNLEKLAILLQPHKGGKGMIEINLAHDSTTHRSQFKLPDKYKISHHMANHLCQEWGKVEKYEVV